MTTTIDPPDSLFAEQQNRLEDDDRPWWQRTLLTKDPVLFGTWDGVFCTVMVNIFGIIVFLRMGWIVGTAGIAHAILLLVICTALALIPVFSAIGICERCQLQTGGIYFLISHVLGGQIGGAVGLIYVFGQAVATGLVAVGFGESVARFFGTDSFWTVKGVAIGVLLVLTGINIAGVRWVVRLQALLLAFLALAVCDFFLGAMFSTNSAHGVGHFNSHRFEINSQPGYDRLSNCSQLGFDTSTSTSTSTSSSFFTVFGVFFANFLGVLAGVNMSGDLKDPRRSIPLGELSAVGCSSVICFLFIIILGFSVDRDWLVCDSLIAEHVSLTRILFLTGLYVSSVSSIVGSLIGTPRVIQRIAAEGLIPMLLPLAQGEGVQKSPIRAAVVMMAVALIFVLLGNLNQLAVLSTMPFLITYAFVNYSYVSLAMSYDLQSVNSISNAAMDKPGYGSMGNIKGDLDRLFPERLDNIPVVADIASTMTTRDGDPGQSAIIGQPASWYSQFSNRYISLAGAVINLGIIVLVHFQFAILHFLALAALYFYIGRSCPSVFPGISQFSIPHMIRTALSPSQQIGTCQPVDAVIPSINPDMVTATASLSEQNRDYAARKQYHHTEQINDFD